MATNWYGVNQNLRPGNYYDSAQDYNENLNPNNPNYGKGFTGIQRFNYNNLNTLPSNLTQDLGASTYQAPVELDTNFSNYINKKSNIDSEQAPDKGFFAPVKQRIRQGIDFLGSKFKRPDEKQAAYEAIMGDRKGLGLWESQTGTYGGTGYDLQQTPSGLKVYSDVNPFGKNFDSMFGSKSLEEMDAKTLNWARKRVLADKRISKRLQKQLEIDDAKKAQRDQTADTANIRQVEAYTGRPMSDYRRSRPASERGFTGHGKSGMGRSADRFAAEGGRIGYQDGELVEDEYMAEATPRGMMEENIEEVQQEPTREQLEAIAFEIFRLPLEQLNEQQLEVVYQAAMEQEPSEEEVQFAAQEGPGEGIASLV